MTSPLPAWAFLAAILAFAAAAHAQGPKPPPPHPAPAVSPVPQQTTASFADWTLRCSRASPAQQSCEVAQTLSIQGRPVAQMVFGRPGKGQPMRFTILVPTSVSFSPAPTLLTAQDTDPPVLELAWRRCMPSGCLADGVVSDDILRRVRTWTDPARVTFPDATGRTATLPFSPKGLAQALDALAKEDAG